MGGKNATKTTAKGRKASRTKARNDGRGTRDELYARARKQGIAGRTKMTKGQLENAL